MHGDADRRIHKQRYSSGSTRRGRSKTPTPRAHTEGPRREETPRDPVSQRAASRTETHKQKASETSTRTRRYTQLQARTPRGTHTHSAWGRMRRSRRPGKVLLELARRTASDGAPRRAPQPASAGQDFASVSLNKGPPAVRVRRPGLGAAITRPRRPGSSDRVPEWRCGPRAAPRGASPLPACSPRPARPPEPSTEHPQVLAFPLVPLRGKLSPGWSRRGAAWPSRAPADGSGSSYLRPRGFAEPPPPAGLSRRSGPRFSVAAAAAAAAPCPPVTRETASPSLPPTNQHRSHGASKPMGDLGIPVLFQGPEPLPRLRDQTGR